MSGGDTEAVPFGSRKDFGFIGTAIYSARMSELLLRPGALTLSELRALWANDHALRVDPASRAAGAQGRVGGENAEVAVARTSASLKLTVTF